MSDCIVYDFVNAHDGDALYSRNDLEMVMMLLYDHDSSSDSSSSEEDDLEDLVLFLLEKPKGIFGPRLNIEDLTNLECEQLFRSVLSLLVQI